MILVILVTTFSALKAAKNRNFWKFLGKIVFSDQFLAPKAPKILIKNVEFLPFDNDFWLFGDHFFGTL